MAVKSMTSRFRHDVDEISTLLGYYAAVNGNLLPKGLPFKTAQYLRRARMSWQQK
jgi:hypothetical protein